MTAVDKLDEIAQILNIKELRKLSRQILEIPDFENKGVINVRVQRPRLMSMAAQGQIPNHLISIATEVIGGKEKSKKTDATILKDAALMMELYSKACLVEPTYEDFKDIMTDQQSDTIFRWAMGQVDSLDSFRKTKADDTDNNNSKEIQKDTK